VPGKRRSGLEREREAAKQNGKLKFTALLHDVSIDLLRDSYYSLKKKAAPGVDGMTWEEYGKRPGGAPQRPTWKNHRRAYRARPSRRTWILKSDGRKRPLGIAALEDKVVQYAVGTVLSQIWEETFWVSATGSGQDVEQQDAWTRVGGNRAEESELDLDLDIRSFFDKLQHDWLVRFVEHRIGDKRVFA